jgi:hypothetical protein
MRNIYVLNELDVFYMLWCEWLKGGGVSICWRYYLVYTRTGKQRPPVTKVRLIRTMMRHIINGFNPHSRMGRVILKDQNNDEIRKFTSRDNDNLTMEKGIPDSCQ